MINETGSGIPDVTVLAYPLERTSTNQEGWYHLKKPYDVIRFSLIGYRPCTKTIEQLKKGPDVVLKKDPTSNWIIPRCKNSGGGRRIKAGFLSFSLPHEIKVKRGSHDMDYQTVLLVHKKYSIVLAWGPTWSYGIPPESALDNLSELKERSIQLTPLEPGLEIQEYRGIRSDGSYWRYIWRNHSI
ncbi:MAG TPA: hypothetical protein VMW38_20665 [Terriglobia bacterium]|nr:hypothetical protein [Terriglobia bacterium]